MATRDLTRDGTAATKRSGVYTPKRSEADEVVRRKAQSFSRIRTPPHQSPVGDSFSTLSEGAKPLIAHAEGHLKARMRPKSLPMRAPIRAHGVRGRDGDARPDARRHRSNETKRSVYGGDRRRCQMRDPKAFPFEGKVPRNEADEVGRRKAQSFSRMNTPPHHRLRRSFPSRGSLGFRSYFA